jgi:ADP-glucose pyrophosphorylase
VVAAGAVVEANSIVTDSVVMAGARIGRRATVRRAIVAPQAAVQDDDLVAESMVVAEGRSAVP